MHMKRLSSAYDRRIIFKIFIERAHPIHRKEFGWIRKVTNKTEKKHLCSVVEFEKVAEAEAVRSSKHLLALSKHLTSPKAKLQSCS